MLSSAPRWSASHTAATARSSVEPPDAASRSSGPHLASSAGFNAEFGPYPGRFREAYQVKLVHAKVLWRCASRTSPGPFYIRTVEPESWTGGTFNEGEPIIPCHPKQRVPVAGNTTGWRKKDKASRYSAGLRPSGSPDKRLSPTPKTSGSAGTTSSSTRVTFAVSPGIRT